MEESTNLMDAALYGQYVDEVTRLINEGEDVNGADSVGSTTLIYSVIGGNVKIIRLLIESGANVISRDKNGWTALMYAVNNPKEKCDEIVELLVNSGAEINVRSKDGWSAPMLIARNLITSARYINRQEIEEFMEFVGILTILTGKEDFLPEDFLEIVKKVDKKYKLYKKRELK